MIDFIHFYTSINGSLVTVLDYFLETKNENKKLNIYHDFLSGNYMGKDDLKNILQRIYADKWINIFKYFSELALYDRTKTYDTLVSTFAIMQFMKERNMKIKFYGKKLILLSSGACMYAQLNNDLEDFIKNLNEYFDFDEMYLLYPMIYKPFLQTNKLSDRFIHHVPYYNKISKKRLDMVHVKNNGNIFLYDDYKKLVKHNEQYIVHHYSQLHYHRWSTYDTLNTYYEHIGKLVFEFIYFNKKSYYSPKNKSFDDGLTEYMKNIFDLDDSKEFYLNDFINKKDIIHKMCLKQNDLFFQLL